MTLDKVISILEEELGVEADEITPESNLKEDLDADSLDLVELVMQLEEEFGIKIQEEDYPKLATVKNIVDFIELKKNATIEA